jgi:RimJ/RimL family protein N-acetyltransferase
MLAPTLRTERLTLCPPSPGDLDAMTAMFADPRVHGPITGTPMTREDAWSRILRYHGHWQVCGYGTWHVHADGVFAGTVGMMDSRRATTPGFEGTPEVGWVLRAETHGRGYATEAVTALLAWADAEGHARTVCIIDPANTPSIRLAERLGYHLVTQATYRDKPTLLFDRPAKG